MGINTTLNRTRRFQEDLGVGFCLGGAHQETDPTLLSLGYMEGERTTGLLNGTRRNCQWILDKFFIASIVNHWEMLNTEFAEPPS